MWPSGSWRTGLRQKETSHLWNRKRSDASPKAKQKKRYLLSVHERYSTINKTESNIYCHNKALEKKPRLFSFSEDTKKQGLLAFVRTTKMGSKLDAFYY